MTNINKNKLNLDMVIQISIISFLNLPTIDVASHMTTKSKLPYTINPT